MSPELALSWFRIAIFFTLVSGALLLFEAPGTAEFVITVTTFVIGFILLALIVFIVKRASG